MLKATLLVCVVFLTACTTSSNTRPFTPMPVYDDQAAVYIYRPSAVSNALYSPDLYVNEEFKLSVKNGKNSHLTLPAGEYKFELEADNNQSKLTTLSLDLKPETTYYLRVTTTLKIKSATDYEPYQRSYILENITEEKAKIEIAECCATDDKKSVAESETEPATKQTDDGFSVDKTQNPFSH